MALLREILLLMLAFAATSVSSNKLSRTHDLRQFNAGHDVYYQPKTGGLGDGPGFSKGKACELERSAIENASVRCGVSGCRVKCDRGYKMEGSRSLILQCDSRTGILTYKDEPWTLSLPPCLPTCGDGCPTGSECVAPNQCEQKAEECPEGFTGPDCLDFHCSAPCQNGGTCIFVDVCHCSPGYSGLQCQQHRCTIPNSPPEQSTIGGDNEITMMDIKCNQGYKMKNGQTSLKFYCNHHQWLTQDEGTNINDLDVNCYA